MIQVYHSFRLAWERSAEELTKFGSLYKDPSMFKLVAEVDTNDLDAAFELTNSIHHYWGENPSVKVVGHLDPKRFGNRSTSVGDVFVLGDCAYVVAPAGFIPLSPNPI